MASNNPKNQQPSIKETRAHLVTEIRAQLTYLKEHSADNPLITLSASSALSSLFEAYLSSLPQSYRGGL